MAFKFALVLCVINILFFTVVTSAYMPPSPSPSPSSPPPLPPPSPPPPSPSPSPSPPPPAPSPPPPPSPSLSSGAQPSCPMDALKLGVCANVLGLVKVHIGNPPTTRCCSLIQGLVDLEAAACLCTAIKANVLGINLNVPLSISSLLNNCGKNVPRNFQCA